MSYCLNIDCQRPVNLDTGQYCQSCGDRLRLKERYRPLNLLGKGGFGRTFLAVDEDIPSQPHCVIKQLYFRSADIEYQNKAIALFQQEAVRLDELGRHPQIPQLLAHFTQGKSLYLIQEFVEGPTLHQSKVQTGVFQEAQIWQLLKEILPVLAFIHERRVIHRDIKPDNIIQCRHTHKPVLIDFGVAKVATGTNWMQTGTVIGSPEFMAPEQARGKTVPATDLYSLGVTCLSLMSTVSPLNMFDIANDQWMWRRFMVGSQSVSDRLGHILDKLLYSALNQRYQSAQEALDALDDHAAVSSTESGESGTPSANAGGIGSATSVTLAQGGRSHSAPEQPNSIQQAHWATSLRPNQAIPPQPTSLPPAPTLPFPSLSPSPRTSPSASPGTSPGTCPTASAPPSAPLPPPPPLPTNLGQGAPSVLAQPNSGSLHPPQRHPIPPNPPKSERSTGSQSPAFFHRLLNRIKPQTRKGQIVSSQGLDYTLLHQHLSQAKWLDADQQTRELMGLAAGQSHRSYLQKGTLKQLPCEDLEILDRLWQMHSDGRFGFSIQVQLYTALEEDYGVFCQQVGWPVHRAPGHYLQATIKAPPGHFPSRNWAGGTRWWHHMDWLQQQWQRCHSATQ